MNSRYGIKLIIVNYLQLMSGIKNKDANREQEISRISGGLKMVAKELDIPVIALSQLLRSAESQGGHKRPMLSHLRDSGFIDQDADVLLCLNRLEYYDIEQWDDYHSEPTNGEAKYILTKNRNGDLVRNRMGFEGQYTRFFDLEDFKDLRKGKKP
ncbi:replicative DNA helicase [Croceimicrobium hydrocarbonivorans]|uniref:DnaB-like helicase C-terminal domain-containing protein n=1 Tax=Croceimicrobium hydrocarbonivorans TaxID=2761580 RepID=A0A7H0VJT0_9FLAO|nr:DnaB-like helicase C-terminal domain-containing protein [Croceimicrobium hydrocarbonivorans]QNR25978.1 DnaB-like helicase C-terminal domain-containing protein [Croceimicrobium hydrocarbonivorans]